MRNNSDLCGWTVLNELSLLFDQKHYTPDEHDAWIIELELSSNAVMKYIRTVRCHSKTTIINEMLPAHRWNPLQLSKFYITVDVKAADQEKKALLLHFSRSCDQQQATSQVKRFWFLRLGVFLCQSLKPCWNTVTAFLVWCTK